MYIYIERERERGQCIVYTDDRMISELGICLRNIIFPLNRHVNKKNLFQICQIMIEIVWAFIMVLLCILYNGKSL